MELKLKLQVAVLRIEGGWRLLRGVKRPSGRTQEGRGCFRTVCGDSYFLQRDIVRECVRVGCGYMCWGCRA